eukprot:CAMPEP_0170175006 /NCGR_PEP_ID=MMETSP0040_2-20121228/8156_1 /TAXON_ID=641309 /ORGANISM="Lotharella oceanica, Strain CCMP622" /LENGTH=275 /DNA_ID=CAMNT_0010416851 /DNA_START=69 /DNA_END=896 /DNA_ORIENTATION=-
MTTYKVKSWPWRKVLPEEFEEGDELKEAVPEFEKVIQGLLDLCLEHPRVGKKLKKSPSKLMDKDMLDIFADDAGLGFMPDDDYKELKPDKKMYMVKMDTWRNNMLSQFKKRKAPSAKIAGSILKKMQEALVKMKADTKTNLEKKAAEEAHFKTMNKFFNAAEEEDLELMDECLKADPWLLNEGHKQKAGATCVMIAVRAKKLKSVKHLIEKKCDLAKEDNFNWTSLNWANEDAEDEVMAEIIKVLEAAGCPEGEGEDDDDSDDFNLAEAAAEMIS